MVQAQYCFEWTELWYGTLQGSIPVFRDDPWVMQVNDPLEVHIIDLLLMFVNQKWELTLGMFGLACYNESQMIIRTTTILTIVLILHFKNFVNICGLRLCWFSFSQHLLVYLEAKEPRHLEVAQQQEVSLHF